MKDTIPIKKVTIPIVSDTLTLSVTGDYHYGLGDINKKEIINGLNSVTHAHKDLIRIFTGDLIENSLKTSVGHGYDLSISDPEKQKNDIISILSETNKVMRSRSKVSKDIPLSYGVTGNHEYRSRKSAGIFVSKDIYNQSKTEDCGIRCILDLTIVNKKIKMSKNYKVFICHKMSSGNLSSPMSFMRAFRLLQSSMPGIDIFVCGHYHQRFMFSDNYINTGSGEIRKVLYVINPSPAGMMEYATEMGLLPTQSLYSCEIFLPLDTDKQIWSYI